MAPVMLVAVRLVLGGGTIGVHDLLLKLVERLAVKAIVSMSAPNYSLCALIK
jgi:hypothetical protein